MEPKLLRLAMLGMTDGNGHPYSWSAIFNGYDRDAMSRCPYPGIIKYLGEQPASALGDLPARVTHIWTDDPHDAPLVAAAARISHVVTQPTDVIGQVDGVLIATDRGEEHVPRARPFVEACLPVFVDKPLCDNSRDLQQFCRWKQNGARLLSSSGLRYSREFAPYHQQPGEALSPARAELGDLRFCSITTCKSWERYGIHALESMYPILGPGFLSAQNSGRAGRDVVHLQHHSGADVVVVAINDMLGALGVLTLGGTRGAAQLHFGDTFHAFKTQMATFVEFMQSGRPPFPFEETVELMKLVIAGILSREQNGRKIFLEEIESGFST